MHLHGLSVSLVCLVTRGWTLYMLHSRISTFLSRVHDWIRQFSFLFDFVWQLTKGSSPIFKSRIMATTGQGYPWHPLEQLLGKGFLRFISQGFIRFRIHDSIQLYGQEPNSTLTLNRHWLHRKSQPLNEDRPSQWASDKIVSRWQETTNEMQNDYLLPSGKMGKIDVLVSRNNLSKNYKMKSEGKCSRWCLLYSATQIRFCSHSRGTYSNGN